jgi:hypothetical protein
MVVTPSTTVEPSLLSSSYPLYWGEQSVGRSRIGIYVIPIRGKSGLQWTGCQVTPGHGWRELSVTDSATEKRPPSSGGKGETVG